MIKNQITTIDAYMATFPSDVQQLLRLMRDTIRIEAPEANEAIKYGMPTFTLNGNLVHFAANKKHIGFYPAPSGITAFSEELKEYKTSKGAIQLPYERPLPIPLIRKIVRFRVQEQLKKI